VSESSGILDLSGKPIPRATIAQLREEVSPVGALFARPPFTGHLAFGMDPSRLGAIIRAADNGSTQEWMILAEEIEELFPHYLSVLSKRKRQVAQLPISVDDAKDVPNAKQHGDLVRAWLKTKAFQRAMYDVLDAIGKGFSVHEIIWATEPGRVWPERFLYRPQRFFELSWEDGATIWLRTQQGFQDLLPHKFLLHTHRTKSGLVVRGGLTRMVAFLWLYSAYTLKDWALFVQGYGLPIRLGRYGPEASDSDKRVLWRAVSSIAGDVAAIIPKSMEMEIVSGTDRNGGATLYGARADWLNREVSKLVLGSTAGTEAIHGGHAVGKEHRQVEEDVERFDAGLVEVSLCQQIIPQMIAFTFGPQKAYPTATIGRPDLVPLGDVINGVADLGPLGFRVKASQLRERLGFEEPEPDDEVVGGPPAPVDKPQIPRGVRPLPMPLDLNASGFLSPLVTLASEAEPEVTHHLVARLAKDAAGALHGLTGQVRHAFDTATDLRDLSHRLHALKLDPEQLTEAMARGMALANLVGQASLVQELQAEQRVERMAAVPAHERDDLPESDFAVPETRELLINDERHVRLAWDMVDRTQGLTAAQRRRARRRILARAKRLRIDTSGWESTE